MAQRYLHERFPRSVATRRKKLRALVMLCRNAGSLEFKYGQAAWGKACAVTQQAIHLSLPGYVRAGLLIVNPARSPYDADVITLVVPQAAKDWNDLQQTLLHRTAPHDEEQLPNTKPTT